jgi:hypothetical protein
LAVTHPTTSLQHEQRAMRLMHFLASLRTEIFARVCDLMSALTRGPRAAGPVLAARSSSTQANDMGSTGQMSRLAFARQEHGMLGALVIWIALSLATQLDLLFVCRLYSLLGAPGGAHLMLPCLHRVAGSSLWVAPAPCVGNSGHVLDFGPTATLAWKSLGVGTMSLKRSAFCDHASRCCQGHWWGAPGAEHLALTSVVRGFAAGCYCIYRFRMPVVMQM